MLERAFTPEEQERRVRKMLPLIIKSFGYIEEFTMELHNELTGWENFNPMKPPETGGDGTLTITFKKGINPHLWLKAMTIWEAD